MDAVKSEAPSCPGPQFYAVAIRVGQPSPSGTIRPQLPDQAERLFMPALT